MHEFVIWTHLICLAMVIVGGLVLRVLMRRPPSLTVHQQDVRRDDATMYARRARPRKCAGEGRPSIEVTQGIFPGAVHRG